MLACLVFRTQLLWQNFTTKQETTGSGKSKMTVFKLKIRISRSPCIQDSNKIPTAIGYLCFRGRATRLDYGIDCPTLGLVVNRRWRPIAGSRNGIACVHDSIEILTTILMFLELGNTTRLHRRLPDVWISWESKMAASN